MPSGCRLEGATGAVALTGATVQEHIRESFRNADVMKAFNWTLLVLDEGHTVFQERRAHKGTDPTEVEVGPGAHEQRRPRDGLAGISLQGIEYLLAPLT